MKKSNFLHKPKDLLSKSFNPAKCKTALKLATSRIKLLKNKKENQIKQMKKELSQLLESGQDRTARIRVEHVIREEKLMAAYELIDIYCELVVARLTIIETQKNCPIDLKEAVTSVIFASARCGDIPELLDVRKQFTNKYGKEFVSAAIEIRPECGVSRMLIEKLSARAPDTQVKIKTLTAIAEEHNINWDPKLLEEHEGLPPNDLLNGPATFVNADRPRAEDTRFSTPHVQAPSPPMKHSPSYISSESNNKSSQGTENRAPGSDNGSSNYVSFIPQSGMRPSGARPDTPETGQSNHQEGSGYSVGRQNWNMNFKDAASAAQAAAESAEHASMAARAAAQLSNPGNFAKQYSPDSEALSGHTLRGEGTGNHSSSKVGEYYDQRESSNSSRVENELKGRRYSVESQKFHEETRSPSSKFADNRSEGLSGHSLRGERTGNHSTSKVGEYYDQTESSNSPRVENELKGRRYSVESQKLHEETRSSSSKYADDRSGGLSGRSLGGEGTGKHSTPKVGDYYAQTESFNSSRVENELKGRRYSVESQKLHEETRSPRSKYADDRPPPSDSANSSFAKQPPEVQNVREDVGNNNTHRASDKSYGNNVGTDKIFPQTSSATSKASFDSDPRLTRHQESERYPENSFFKGEKVGPESTFKNETYKDEPERVNSHEEGYNYYNHDIFKEEKITKQSSNINSSPHSSGGFDDNVVDSGTEKHGSDSRDHHFNNQDLFDKMTESSSHHDGGVVSFDDYGSDEDSGFHNSSSLNFKDESTLFHPSERTSPPRPVGSPSSGLHRDSESLFPTKQNIFVEFSDTSDVVDSSEQEKIGSVMFDDSDGPSSDNEIDMDHQRSVQNVKESTDSSSKQYQTRSSASSSFHDTPKKNNQRNESVVQRQEDFGLSKALVDDSSPRLGKSRQNSGVVGEVETSSSSSMTHIDDEDSHNGLNFGKLTGGLRHKGRTRFPYQSRQSDDLSNSPTVKAVPAHATENILNVKKREIPEKKRSPRLQSSNLDSDSETSEEAYEKTPSRKSTIKLNVRSPVRYLDSESDDDDDSAKRGFTGQSSPFGSGVSRRKDIPADSTSTRGVVSRRTKANTSADSASSSSKFQEKSHARSTSTSSFSSTETPPPTESHVWHSGRTETSLPTESHVRRSDRTETSPPSASHVWRSDRTQNSPPSESLVRRSGHTETPPPSESHVRRSDRTQTSPPTESHVRRSGSTETPPPSESHVGRSGQLKDIERSSPARKGYTISNMESNVSANIENKKPSVGAQQTGTSEQKGELSSGASSKQASHVHPKLPDYDTIASSLRPHRTNRQ